MYIVPYFYSLPKSQTNFSQTKRFQHFYQLLFIVQNKSTQIFNCFSMFTFYGASPGTIFSWLATYCIWFSSLFFLYFHSTYAPIACKIVLQCQIGNVQTNAAASFARHNVGSMVHSLYRCPAHNDLLPPPPPPPNVGLIDGIPGGPPRFVQRRIRTMNIFSI